MEWPERPRDDMQRTADFRPPARAKKLDTDRGPYYIVAYRGGSPLTILSTHPSRGEGVKALEQWRRMGLEHYDDIRLETRTA